MCRFLRTSARVLSAPHMCACMPCLHVCVDTKLKWSMVLVTRMLYARYSRVKASSEGVQNCCVHDTDMPQQFIHFWPSFLALRIGKAYEQNLASQVYFLAYCTSLLLVQVQMRREISTNTAIAGNCRCKGVFRCASWRQGAPPSDCSHTPTSSMARYHYRTHIIEWQASTA